MTPSMGPRKAEYTLMKVENHWLSNNTQGKVITESMPASIVPCFQVMLKRSWKTIVGGRMLMVKLVVTWASTIKTNKAIPMPTDGATSMSAATGSPCPATVAVTTPITKMKVHGGTTPKRCPKKLVACVGGFRWRVKSEMFNITVARIP